MAKITKSKKAVPKKRQRKSLPLLHVQKQNKLAKSTKKTKAYKIWFGPQRVLEIKLTLASKKKNIKTKPKSKTKKSEKQNYTNKWFHNSHSLAVLGLSGIYIFSKMIWSTTPPPAPVYSTPAPAVIEKVEQTGPVGLNASMPVFMQIESVGIKTTIASVDLNTDGTLEVPKSYDHVGWYKRSPTPGELGPSVITGHVDSYKGPAVFWKLGHVKAGDKVVITREDGSIVTFIVDRVEQFSQDSFPTDQVYGNTENSGLRLITCGGYFQRTAQRYTHNTVVFASVLEPTENI